MHYKEVILNAIVSGGMTSTGMQVLVFQTIKSKICHLCFGFFLLAMRTISNLSQKPKCYNFPINRSRNTIFCCQC